MTFSGNCVPIIAASTAINFDALDGSHAHHRSSPRQRPVGDKSGGGRGSRLSNDTSASASASGTAEEIIMRSVE
ncbi:hypothetical protein RRG08_004291 [Elysia crispata]|uniref:Uncharacterized protein n=1 Tax=Elysia crispata TaxID=231223 RepID=A0AAE0YCB5_9GAST|nr:hypothetical protein RRG08_004291 [Elysia crispata]